MTTRESRPQAKGGVPATNTSSVVTDDDPQVPEPWTAPPPTDPLAGARQLIKAGVPVFVAPPDPSSPTGYRLPKAWQHTRPDESILGRWRQGWAVCAVMGHTLDLLDVDPRHGGDTALAQLEAAGLVPTIYARATTPSGGQHLLVASLGVRSRDGVRPGVDVKAGTGGQGHGFAFLAPTVRTSKTSGEPVAYKWTQEPDAAQILAETPDDDTGSELARLVREAHGPTPLQGPPDALVSPAGSPWADVAATLAGGRHAGVHALASALRGRGGWRVEDVLEYLRRVVFPQIDQTQGGHPYTLAELEADVRDVFDRYPDGAVGVVEDTSADSFTLDVARAAQRLRVQEAARELVARETAGELVLPEWRSLADLLAEPDDALVWSVDRLLATDSKGLLAAQHKAGKTTLGGNLVRSWVDGVPFLGEFATAPAGNVVVIDNEMGARRLKRWYRQLGIAHPERVDLVDLRGKASTFNILDKSTRSRWAERIAEADAALLDCLRPFLDALGLDEHREIGRFLEALDELMAEAEVRNYVLSHHTGHDGEHARGDSRVLDWPDEIWNLRRAKPADPKAPESDRDVPRFLSAYGRESEVREGQVELGADGRDLVFRAGVTRASARADVAAGKLLTEVLSAAVQEVGADAWFGIGQVAEWVGKDPKTVRPALDRGVGNGLLAKQPNPHGSGSVFSLVTGGREGRDSSPLPTFPRGEEERYYVARSSSPLDPHPSTTREEAR